MKRRRAYRIGLVLTGMALPALAAEIDQEKLRATKTKVAQVEKLPSDAPRSKAEIRCPWQR